MPNNTNDPNLTTEEITLIGTRYHITVDPDNATHYKLCRVINQLETSLWKREKK